MAEKVVHISENYNTYKILYRHNYTFFAYHDKINGKCENKFPSYMTCITYYVYHVYL